MIEFRVTKYNPSLRNADGVYSRDEWTSVDDIGRSFSGATFTEAEYDHVETAYASVAMAFLREVGAMEVTVTTLENYAGVPLPIDEGSALSLSKIEYILRMLLRGEFWCRLEGPECFIHVGHDYCMYVGVCVSCPESVSMAGRLGLFVEPFRSPYAAR